eukprot:m.140300 g.140300  ORF g.140300 m.140300 type:complete len:426 (+) comp17657_c0_seq1:429-1706(+)
MAGGSSRSSSNGDTQVAGTVPASGGTGIKNPKPVGGKNDRGRYENTRREAKRSTKQQQSNGIGSSSTGDEHEEDGLVCIENDQDSVETTNLSNQTEQNEEKDHTAEDANLEAERLHHEQAMKIHAEEYSTLKERLFQTRLAKVQVMLDDLREGKLQRFLNQKSRLEAQAQSQLEAAKVRKHLQVIALDHHCEYTTKNAHEDYEDGVKVLKQKMIADLEENLHQINTAKLEMDTPMSPSLSGQLFGSESSKNGGKRSQSRNKGRSKRAYTGTMSTTTSPSAGGMPYPGMHMGRPGGSPYHGSSPNAYGSYHSQQITAQDSSYGAGATMPTPYGSMHGIHQGGTAVMPHHYHVASQTKKRRRTPTVTMQPYVVYMLTDKEIGEDLSRLHSAYTHAVSGVSGGMIGMQPMNPHRGLISNVGHASHLRH